MTEIKDDGLFCMSIQDYLKYFAVTSFCSEQAEDYVHSQFSFSYEDDNSKNFAPQAFFKVQIP